MRQVIITFDNKGDVGRVKSQLTDDQIKKIVSSDKVYQAIECLNGGDEFFVRADDSLDSSTPDEWSYIQLAFALEIEG